MSSDSLDQIYSDSDSTDSGDLFTGEESLSPPPNDRAVKCQCCQHTWATCHCWECEKQLCHPCSYEYRGNVFCRQNFKDCFHSWLEANPLTGDYYPGDVNMQIDPNEYRMVIPCSHVMEQRSKEKNRRARNQARKEAKKERKMLNAQGQRDLSFFIPDDQVEIQPSGWRIWKKQDEFNQAIRQYKPEVLYDCEPFSLFFHPKKNVLSHSYHLYFQPPKDFQGDDGQWKKWVNQFYKKQIWPWMEKTFGVEIRS